MKNRIMYMFLILQFLLVISNFQNIDNTLFSVSMLDILKIVIVLFSSIYILFIAKNSLLKKIIYSSILFFTYVAFFYDGYSLSDLLTNYYYVSTFTFLIFYSLNNKIDKFMIVELSSFSLFILDIALLFNHQVSITIELLVLILLAISFSLYNQYKKIFVPLYLLTLIVSSIINMNFVLYNTIVLSLIVLFSKRNKKDLINGLLLFVLSFCCLLINELLSSDKLFSLFGSFDISINATSFVIVVPLIMIVCYMISKYIINKDKSLEIKINLYISIVLITLMMISIDNVYNEFLIVIFSLLLVLIIERINNSNKKLKNDITFFLLHLGYGGIESSTVNTANELSKIYRVRIVSFYNLKRNIENTLDKSIKVQYLYNGAPNKEELIDSIKNRNYLSIVKNSFKAIKILLLKQHLVVKEMYQCDSRFIVSTRNEFNILLSEYGNVHAVKIAQEHMHHRDNKKYINNIKYGYNNIDYLFALTNSLKKDYEEFLKDNKNTKVFVVPNIIYLPKKKSSLKNKNLITISRLNSIKKIDDMITIFSKIKSKKSKLYIVGDGEELDKLKNLSVDLKIDDRVIFTGYKTKAEMEEFILDSSIFLLTSWSEGLPMVLLEAMSYGVPCVAFETKSGVADIIDDNINGFIIKNRNKEKYVEKIDELLNNKELLNEFSKNSIIKAKKYTAKEIIKKWQEVIDSEK